MDQINMNRIEEISRKVAYSILRESKDGKGWDNDPSAYQYIRYDVVQTIIHMILALFTAFGDRFHIPFDDLWELAGGAYDEAVIRLIKEGAFNENGIPTKEIQ